MKETTNKSIHLALQGYTKQGSVVLYLYIHARKPRPAEVITDCTTVTNGSLCNNYWLR